MIGTASDQPTLTAISGRFSAVFFTELLGSSVSKKIQVKPLSRSAVIGSSIGHLRSKVKKTTQVIIEVKPRIRSAILNHILKQEAGEDLILQSCKFRYIIYGGCTPARQWGRCNPGVHGYSFECYIASILEQVTLCQQMSLTLKGFLNIQTRNKFQVKTQHRTLSEKKESSRPLLGSRPNHNLRIPDRLHTLKDVSEILSEHIVSIGLFFACTIY